MAKAANWWKHGIVVLFPLGRYEQNSYAGARARTLVSSSTVLSRSRDRARRVENQQLRIHRLFVCLVDASNWITIIHCFCLLCRIDTKDLEPNENWIRTCHFWHRQRLLPSRVCSPLLLLFSHLSFMTMVFRERLYTSRNIYFKISLLGTYNKIESFSLNEKMYLFCN